jgi:hypothetical protein
MKAWEVYEDTQMNTTENEAKSRTADVPKTNSDVLLLRQFFLGEVNHWRNEMTAKPE